MVAGVETGEHPPSSLEGVEQPSEAVPLFPQQQQKLEDWTAGLRTLQVVDFVLLPHGYLYRAVL